MTLYILSRQVQVSVGTSPTLESQGFEHLCLAFQQHSPEHSPLGWCCLVPLTWVQVAHFPTSKSYQLTQDFSDL